MPWNLTMIASGNGLLSGQHRATAWIKGDLLAIWENPDILSLVAAAMKTPQTQFHGNAARVWE